MAKTTKTTKRSAKSGRRTFRPSAFHSSVFAHPNGKRCGHRSKTGKVCARFAGHARAPHLYVAAKELKAKQASWVKRFA